jgi:GNAT superfamily N-acetyltransferase
MRCVLKVSPKVNDRDLHALFASAWPDYRAVRMQRLLKCALIYVCAYEGRRLIGFGKIIGDGGVHGFLLDPTVAPDCRRKGIGRRVVTRCLTEARRLGVKWVHVDYEPSLRAFYRHCGFHFTEASLVNLKSKHRTGR